MYSQKLEEGVGSPGTGVTDNWEPPYGCKEPNPHPLEEKPVLLTTILSPLSPVFKVDPRVFLGCNGGVHFRPWGRADTKETVQTMMLRSA